MQYRIMFRADGRLYYAIAEEIYGRFRIETARYATSQEAYDAARAAARVLGGKYEVT